LVEHFNVFALERKIASLPLAARAGIDAAWLDIFRDARRRNKNRLALAYAEAL
jgi:hypothetical protein